MLRKTCGPKREEITWEWRKLHNEKLYDLYSSSNIIRAIKSRQMKWAWHDTSMGERRGAHRGLVGKRKGKRPLGRNPGVLRDDNIKMDLQKVVCCGMDWIDLAQDTDKWRTLANVGNFLTS